MKREIKRSIRSCSIICLNIKDILIEKISADTSLPLKISDNTYLKFVFHSNDSVRLFKLLKNCLFI